MNSAVPGGHYIPGLCNIGSAEIARRKRVGWTGMLAAVITWSLLIWIHPGRIWSLILFVPATLSAMGFIQGQLHFCAGFGLTHLYNFGPGAGTADTVLQAEFRKQDRRKAVQIIAYSLAAGAGISLIAFLSTENR